MGELEIRIFLHISRVMPVVEQKKKLNGIV